MSTKITADWLKWIKVNIANGQDRNHLFNILLGEGFSYEAIAEAMQFSPTPEDCLNPQWQNWLTDNIANGIDKNILFKICIDEGFSFSTIEQAMNFSPTTPLEEVNNPLTNSAAQSGETIDLTSLFIPNAETHHIGLARIFCLHNFLTNAECRALRAELLLHINNSQLDGIELDQNLQLGGICNLNTNSNELIADIDRRICNLVAIDSSFGEDLQGTHCNTDPEINRFFEAIEKSELKSDNEGLGIRSVGVTIYLNDVTEGGEMVFTDTELSFTPAAGKVVIWSTEDSDNPTICPIKRRSQPVIKGYKAAITKWFRNQSKLPNPPPMYNRDANEIIPAYTKAGFIKQSLPDILFSKIKRFYTENSATISEETVAGDYILKGKGSKVNGSSLIDLSDDLRNEIHDQLKTSMERWSGQDLLPTYVYGIRIYHRGAILRPHRDRLATHIIGAIISVAQDVDEDWPLIIYDHQHREHSVILKPGDVVFYESGTLIHGRPSPLNGNSFANVFCHCKPVNYVPRPTITN
jgi:prolyl 4-hydroxylase